MTRTNSRTIGRISSKISSLEAFSRAVRLNLSMRWRWRSTFSDRKSSETGSDWTGCAVAPLAATGAGTGCDVRSLVPLMKRPNMTPNPCYFPDIETKR
ncbi:hypothetical protein MPLSOD_50029 [Mesorhizobium sp. SOD10]|nr:hypothetical protein MPLSOD_50029 [Mesorhizobium sp. SOD10]